MIHFTPFVFVVYGGKLIQSLIHWMDTLITLILEFHSRNKKHREFLDDSIKKSGEEEAELLLKFFGEDTKNFDYEFPRRAFSNFITGFYSTYEETLLSICKYFDLNLVVGPFDQFDNLKIEVARPGRTLKRHALGQAIKVILDTFALGSLLQTVHHAISLLLHPPILNFGKMKIGAIS